jgi:hypothetical protein
MIEVTLEVLTDKGCQEVSAEVEMIGANDFVVLWSDVDAVRRLGLPSVQLLTLVRRCEAECRWLEWQREAEGIAPLLDDVAPAHSADRDHRISEVA